MNIFEDEVVNFMKLLNKNQVKYILVGGMAVNYFGYGRTTGDVDLWLEDSLENRTRLVTTLTDFGIEGAAVFLSLPLIAGYSEVLLGNGIYVDFMSDMVALKQEQFGECYLQSEKFQLEPETQLNFLNFNKLIEEKTKSGRPKDLNDIEELNKAANKKRNNSPN
ncbi:MAG: hypothetical protein ABIQ40_13765 [Bacteroidia bacterium]